MNAIHRLSWILLAMIIAMMTTGGVIIPLKKGFVEISQVNVWALLLGLLTIIELRWGGSSRPPAIRALNFLLDISAKLRRPALALVVGLGAFGLIAALLHSFRLYQLDTDFMDQGIIHHVLVSTWERKPFQCEFCMNGNFLGDHLAFTFLLIAPIAGFFRSNEVIFLIQGLVLAGGTFALLRYGPLRERRELWLVGALAVLCHSFFRFNWHYVDFREDHLAFLFLSLAAVGAYQLNWPAFIAGSFLAMLSKENVAFIIPFLALTGVLQARRQTEGPARRRAFWILALVTIASCAWIILSFKVLLPHFIGNSKTATEIASRFSGMGTTPSEVIIYLLTHPFTTAGLIASNTFDPLGRKYVLLLLLPWSYLLWKGKTWIIPALPGILMNLVSGRVDQRTLRWHYELVIYPFLILATLEGIRRCSKKELLLGLFLAISFSERWPGILLQQRWPSPGQRENVAWFYSVPKEGLLGAPFNILGPASMRASVVPIGSFGEVAHPSWQSFRDVNILMDPEQKKDYWVDRARWLILDGSDPVQTALIANLPSEWTLRSRSPDERFALLENRRN